MAGITSAGTSASVTYETSLSASQSSTFQLPTAAPWLAAVQRRLSNSIGVQAGSAPRPAGEWLGRDVVSAANTFLLATSDLLPKEPYLYSSGKGDLIAEFPGLSNGLTMVVSKDHALAMAVVNGKPVQNKISLVPTELGKLRAELSKVIAEFHATLNGPVESER